MRSLSPSAYDGSDVKGSNRVVLTTGVLSFTVLLLGAVLAKLIDGPPDAPLRRGRRQELGHILAHGDAIPEAARTSTQQEEDGTMTLQQEIEGTDELRMKGAMLVRVRGMRLEELAAEGWQDSTEDVPCTEYDNGAVLYSACERCNQPGTIYASWAGSRWGITSSDEPYERPLTSRATPKWVYPAVALAVFLMVLAATGVVTLWKVNQDQRVQVHQQQQIIREQQVTMNRQLENQRIIRGNQAALKKSLQDIKDQVSGVVAERDGLRAANAQLSQSNEQLKKRLGGRGGR